MAKRGKKPLPVPNTKWTVYINPEIAAKVELILCDPMRDKVKYNARNTLLNELLARWIAEQERRETAEIDRLMDHQT